ncbi:hypothetical protein [Bifidobacterium myosotis]|nr:hypothetical protein [Bifidobacterium myosotis]
MVGYDNPLYFSRIYSKYEGVSPSRQREMGGQPFAVTTMPNP